MVIGKFGLKQFDPFPIQKNKQYKYTNRHTPSYLCEDLSKDDNNIEKFVQLERNIQGGK